MVQFVDMAKSPEEIKNDVPLAASDQDKYPWGLRLSLTQDELEKLDVDHSDWEVGATFHIHALVKVSSISENETEAGGKNCCVSLQITHLAAESEDEENEESDEEDGGYGAYTKDKETKPDLRRHGYMHRE